ncbi:hypothetical protein RIEGSTA812A_PEG_892 [invertebrate metagenome]|uniref:Uncharacterized protein n=1 Tax=invertebrate metagenome TaxID=1711999 RepID=A0A484H5W8_9ZZZZ
MLYPVSHSIRTDPGGSKRLLCSKSEMKLKVLKSMSVLRPE